MSQTSTMGCIQQTGQTDTAELHLHSRVALRTGPPGQPGRVGSVCEHTTSAKYVHPNPHNMGLAAGMYHNPAICTVPGTDNQHLITDTAVLKGCAAAQGIAQVCKTAANRTVRTQHITNASLLRKGHGVVCWISPFDQSAYAPPGRTQQSTVTQYQRDPAAETTRVLLKQPRPSMWSRQAVALCNTCAAKLRTQKQPHCIMARG